MYYKSYVHYDFKNIYLFDLSVFIKHSEKCPEAIQAHIYQMIALK